MGGGDQREKSENPRNLPKRRRSYATWPHYDKALYEKGIDVAQHQWLSGCPEKGLFSAKKSFLVFSALKWPFVRQLDNFTNYQQHLEVKILQDFGWDSFLRDKLLLKHLCVDRWKK